MNKLELLIQNKDSYYFYPKHRRKTLGKGNGKLRTLFITQNGSCHYCGCQCELTLISKPKQATKDHKIPKVKCAELGLDANHEGNVVMACRKCNTKKGHMSYEAFKAGIIE